MARRKRKSKPISTLATTMVENPDWRPDRDGEKPFPRYIDAVIRCRPGTFAWRFGRDKNSLEYQAGNRFAMLWERAGMALPSSSDYTRTRVSSGISMGKSDACLDAIQKLDGVRELLGLAGESRLIDYCVWGMTAGEIAAKAGWGERPTSNVLQMDLMIISGHFGLSASRTRRVA